MYPARGITFRIQSVRTSEKFYKELGIPEGIDRKRYLFGCFSEIPWDWESFVVLKDKKARIQEKDQD